MDIIYKKLPAVPTPISKVWGVASSKLANGIHPIFGNPIFFGVMSFYIGGTLLFVVRGSAKEESKSLGVFLARARALPSLRLMRANLESFLRQRDLRSDHSRRASFARQESAKQMRKGSASKWRWWWEEPNLKSAVVVRARRSWESWSAFEARVTGRGTLGGGPSVRFALRAHIVACRVA